VITKTLHFALSKSYPDAQVIIDDFNREIGEMIIDGTYHEILELNWIRADVDGDGNLELIPRGTVAGTEAPKSIYSINSAASGSSGGRYYIDGKFYNSWEEVPGQSKIRIPKTDTPVDPGKGEMRIKLK
jgi:hypothetical protein